MFKLMGKKIIKSLRNKISLYGSMNSNTSFLSVFIVFPEEAGLTNAVLNYVLCITVVLNLA